MNSLQSLGIQETGTVAYEAGVSEVACRAYGYSQRGDGWARTDQNLTSASTASDSATRAHKKTRRFQRVL